MIDVDALRTLGSQHRVRFTRGHILYREGDSSGPLYVVLRGAVSFSIVDERERERVVERVRVGEFFGEVSCFGGSPRSTTARVEEDDTVLLVVDAEAAFGLLAASPRFGTAVIQRLCERVRQEAERNSVLTAQVVEAQTANAQLQEQVAKLQDEAAPKTPKVNWTALASGIAEAARSARVPGEDEPAKP